MIVIEFLFIVMKTFFLHSGRVQLLCGDRDRDACVLVEKFFLSFLNSRWQFEYFLADIRFTPPTTELI